MIGHRMPLLPTIVRPRRCHYLGQQVVETLKTSRGMVRVQLRGLLAVVVHGQPIESRLPGRARILRCQKNPAQAPQHTMPRDKAQAQTARSRVHRRTR
jgi:hypothetical protein